MDDQELFERLAPPKLRHEARFRARLTTTRVAPPADGTGLWLGPLGASSRGWVGTRGIDPSPGSNTAPSRGRKGAVGGAANSQELTASSRGWVGTWRLAPAGLLVEVDAEGGLADDLVRQQRVGRVEAAAADVAVEPLELVAP